MDDDVIRKALDARTWLVDYHKGPVLVRAAVRNSNTKHIIWVEDGNSNRWWCLFVDLRLATAQDLLKL